LAFLTKKASSGVCR